MGECVNGLNKNQIQQNFNIDVYRKAKLIKYNIKIGYVLCDLTQGNFF